MSKVNELDKSTPYYEQIRAYLLAEIEAGSFPPHTQIPSERSLSQQFGVSRMTVKHAIQELVFNGRLYTQVGKGTFVADPPITQQLTTLTSFSEDMASLSKRPASRVLEARITLATEKVARGLNLEVGASVTYLQRLRLADEAAIAIESSYLNTTHCPGILNDHNFAEQSLYAVLRTRYNIAMHHAEQDIRARLANSAEAKLLQVPKGSPVLYITRVTFTTHDTPIEYVESAYRGDRYTFRARLNHS